MSSKTYYSVKHLQETRVIPAKSIQAVVAMVPDHQYGKYIQDGSHIDRWQVIEKPGLKLDQRILDDGEGILDM
jgi:hypothetical protein